MDLFDLGCYFSHRVPVEAKSKPLLRHAICACAAKQLGRVDSFKNADSRACRNNGNLELDNWSWRGAKHYEKAIKLFAKEISSLNIYPPQEREHEELPLPLQLCQSHLPRTSETAAALNRDETNITTDDILTAAAILCMYEFLDNTTTAWTQHLSGAKVLFELFHKSDAPQVADTPRLSELRFSRARRAIFWNFAHQDVLAACK